MQLGAFVHTPDTRSMATFRAIATTSGSRLSTVQNGKFTNYRVGAFKKFDDVKAAVENAGRNRCFCGRILQWGKNSGS